MCPCAQRGAKGASTDSNAIPVDGPTTAFIEAVCSAPHIAAVLSGHVQESHSMPIGSGDCVQYVTAAGYTGAYRWLEFVPSSAAKL